ncbi:MAG: Two component signal transduction histidine kinase [Acidimicrobiaceae bacterium]|nr:Two component signal transduction histidine kinase [Acidimicrobiaceae bacterium]
MAHRLSLVVLFVGLVLVAIAVFASRIAYEHNESRLLSLQVRLTGSALSADSLYVEDHLGGAAQLAAASNGRATGFADSLSDSVSTSGPFACASLWRMGSGTDREITAIGSAPLLGPSSPALRSFLHQAAQAQSFVVQELSGHGESRLGFAMSAPGPGGPYVAYAEEILPANHRTAESASSPIGEVNLAIYLGRSERASRLLETDSTLGAPLRGTTATTTVPYGNTVLTLVMSPRGSLSGGVSRYSSWVIGFLGSALVLLVALMTQRLVRRRERAERLTLEIADLYAEQRSIAETLQLALLPRDMPGISGMEFAVRYLPGARGVDIGGDWYDVVPLDEERFVFVIGDVSGRGVRAASIMASLHYAIRGFVVEGHDPVEILETLSRMLSVTRDDHFATVLVGLVEVASHQVTLANAGHLPPLLVSEGEASFVPTEIGPPIGYSSRSTYAPVTFKVPPAGTLVVYTDGLVERRGESLDQGLERLRAFATGPEDGLEDLVSTLLGGLSPDGSDDDTAILGLRWLD